jgi:hypothetical protein
MSLERLNEQVAVSSDDRPRHPADRGDRGASLRSRPHHVEQRSIWNRRSVRHIFSLGDPVAGHAEREEKGFLFRREVVAATRPAHVRMGVEDMRILHAGRRLSESPLDAGPTREFAVEQLPEEREVAHIVGGVPQLRRGERSRVPIGEGVAFRERELEKPIDELRKRGGIGDADEAGGHLNVDDIPWGAADGPPDRAQVARSGVNDRRDRAVADERPERAKIGDREGIDQPDALRRRELDQAGARQVGDLADELGVEREGPHRPCMVEKTRKFGVGADELRIARRHPLVRERRRKVLGTLVSSVMMLRALSPAKRHEIGHDTRSSGVPSVPGEVVRKRLLRAAQAPIIIAMSNRSAIAGGRCSMQAIVRAMLVGLTLWALGALGGCRRPEPVYDRIPRPIATRDLVRAERRAGQPLSESERRAVVALLDRSLEAFEALRSNEILPFAEAYRALNAQGAYADPQALRSIVSRHRGILLRIEGIDDDLFRALAETLGPQRASLIAHLRIRRAIDRASVLSLGDGGRTLLDVRTLVAQLELEPETLATIEPILQDFDRDAAEVARRIAEEQATLPLRYMEVIERRGPAERSVDPALRDDARKQARDRAEHERYAESRRDLETHLFRYAEIAELAIESVAVVLPEEDGAFLRRRMLRLRVDDEIAGGSDRAAFEALVAARAIGVPRETRQRIEELRVAFLAEDEERLRAQIALHVASREPGVFDPIRRRGGDDAVRRHKESWARLEEQRKSSAERFRNEIAELLPEETRAAIEQLRNLDRDQFVDRLAELVGPGRVSTFVQRKPQGYADRDPQRADAGRDANRDGGRDPGELRMMLASPPTDGSIELLQRRSGMDDDAIAGAAGILREVVTPWRERWEATREPARTKVRQWMGPIMEAMNAADEKAFDQAAARLIAGFDGLRREREALDGELLASLEVVLPSGVDPAARELWVRERSEAARRLRWSELPFEDTLRMPPEATVGFLDAVARAPIPPERASVIVAALAPFADRLDEATERLRREALVAVRKAMVIVMEGRRRGMSEEDSLSEAKPEVRAMLSPLQGAANDLASLRIEALNAIASALPPLEGRAMREQFVRSAYPRLLDERRTTERAIDAVGADPSLTTEQRVEWERIVDDRTRARDAAIGRLLAWGEAYRAAERPKGEELGGRETAGRRHPQLAAVAFERDEANARAVRAAWGILSPEQRERHRELERWFSETAQQVRWLD